MDLVLDLNNFNSPQADESRYVLTSPRSLEACARMKVRPVQLLPKPIEEFIEENPGKPLPLLQVFHDNHELKRVELLQKCKEMRQTIIMENSVNQNQKSDKILNGKISDVQHGVKGQVIQTRMKASPSPRQKEPGLIKPSKKPQVQKLKGDENNNVDHIPKGSAETLTSDLSGKMLTKPSITPRKFKDLSNPAKASFTKSRSRRISNSTDEDSPYMITSPVIPTQTTVALARSYDQRGRMSRNGDAMSRARVIAERNRADRKRSRSLDVARRKPQVNIDIELASSLKFASSNFMSGQSTPRQQRDQKMVELMKEKRKLKETDAVRASEKQKEWEEEKKIKERKKLEEYLARERGLRQSQLDWEKRIKENEERRVREQKRNEIAKISSIEETDKQVERKKREQARIQQIMIDEKRRADAQKKKLQEIAKETVDKERQAFLDATGRELEIKLERAQRAKLEKEFQLLNKLKYMNKVQREKFQLIVKELENRKLNEAEKKRTEIHEKMEKADILRTKKITERDQALQRQAEEEELKIFNTKIKQAEIDMKKEEHLQSIAEHRKEALRRANAAQLQNIQFKAKRVQEKREAQHEEQKKRLKQIEKEDEKHLVETKEQLEAKDIRAKTHQQLKEAAIQMSRTNARAAEAARLEVKQKDDTFLEAAKHVTLLTSIGRGPRTGLVNASSVKFG